MLNNYDTDYYMWLLERVEESDMMKDLYSDLFRLLFDTEYTYTFVMDENRAKGGESLRSIFAAEKGVFVEDVCSGPCRVLEMIEAIATEMAMNQEASIHLFFWELIENLGLMGEINQYFDKDRVHYILNRWMNRQFEPDGTGSLFPIKGFEGDMRNIEVWDQMNIYMTKKYPVGEWLT